MFKRFIGIITIITVMVQAASSQQSPAVNQLRWTEVRAVSIAEGYAVHRIEFDGATYLEEFGDLPVYSGKEKTGQVNLMPEVKITSPVFESLSDDILKVRGIEKVTDRIEVKAHIALDRKIPFTVYTFLPIRKNPLTGRYEKLVSFVPEITYREQPVTRSQQAARSYSDQSVLATGNWYKIAVSSDGIHIITFADLQQMGIDPSGIDPRNIRIYGNGGGMLPENLQESRYDDLIENSILVSGEGDGKFDAGDYILFYGESPHTWKYNSSGGYFYHTYNIYSEKTCYFLSTDLGPGKRILTESSTTLPNTSTVTKFVDRQFHEQDLYNLVNTGRIWYGEVFDISTVQEFSFDFPDIDNTAEAYFKAYIAAKSSSTTQFRFYDGNKKILEASITGIPPTSETFARSYSGSNKFTPSGNPLKIRAEYIKSSGNSTGWLNYLELNVTRYLRFTGEQMTFRETSAFGPGEISEFRLSNASSDIIVWNVTDAANAKRINGSLSGSEFIFRIPNDTLQEFIAFTSNTSTYLPIEKLGPVANQNLHGLEPTDLIIISHRDFFNEAERLADHHRDYDNLKVTVVELGLIYNEFSSGEQDLTAIRDFMKMMYDKGGTQDAPKYLLLFGDASFDFKDRINNNSNFIPTWEDDESLTIVYSIATDDYFGFLDHEVANDNLLDIGIGRFPVETPEQAGVAVDKVIAYVKNSESMAEWRNYVCFVADDQDGNLHLNQAEDMGKKFDTAFQSYNVDKIYVDAFSQVTTPGGQRAPDVNKAINNRMEKGALVVNYTGHGGEVGWGHERFLEISDIDSWKNSGKFPIFITATCEFSRYDDPERLSAGEMVYRNPEGGAIAMFTTARATFGGSNFNLNQALYSYMFSKQDGEYPRFGDLIRLSKNENGVVDNDMKFILLGNPALKLAYPVHDVQTVSINSISVSGIPDTLKALDKVTVQGEIRDISGNKLSDYNGTLYSTVFDKPSEIVTLATDPDSYAKEFELQHSILYKGKANITNGEYSFTFIVPKDIAYDFGPGKISYYATNGQEDASGYYKNIIVGGYNNNASADQQGPEVRLFLNDEQFAFGGMTNERPTLLAFVSDENGINTVGNGIGHDLVAILDENTDKPIVLNEYYEADVDSYQSGSIRYPFPELSEGKHTLSLKVWDVYNNSSTAFTEFTVVKEAELSIDHILNYPNPFTTHTEFFFEHNHPGRTLEVQVQVFTISGKLVKTIETISLTDGYRSDPIPWDGRDDFGDPIGRGVYLYNIRVRDDGGNIAEKMEKLVILN